MAATYHAAESCEKSFADFTDRVNPWFVAKQKSLIIAQFEKCISDRKVDPLYRASELKPKSEWKDKDYSHYNVVIMFEGLLNAIRTIREDRLDAYHLELIPTRKKAVKIVLSKAVEESDKIVKQKVRKGVREATDEEWAQAEKESAAAGPAAAGAPSAGRRRTRRKNGRRRTQKKRKTYV